MDNLESAISDVHEEVAQLQARRAELDHALEALETRWRMLEGKSPETHRHRCPHWRGILGLPTGLWGGLPA